MTTHELKTWPRYFDAIQHGRKTFEYRLDDRGYVEGDLLLLREWEPGTEEYSGREAWFRVGYVMRLNSHPSYVVMALLPAESAS